MSDYLCFFFKKKIFLTIRIKEVSTAGLYLRNYQPHQVYKLFGMPNCFVYLNLASKNQLLGQ